MLIITLATLINPEMILSQVQYGIEVTIVSQPDRWWFTQQIN